MHIVLFKGRLSTLDFFTDKVVEYFTKNKIDYYLVDTNRAETYNCKEFDEYICQNNCVMFTFNNIGIKFDEDDENIWKRHGIKVVDFIVDPPRAFEDILLMPDCDIYVISLDKNRNEFIKEFYPHIKEVFFLPMAGAEVCSDIPLCKRDIDVIYMGNGNRCDVPLPEIEIFDDGGNKFYKSVVNELIEHSEQTTEQAVRKYIERTAKIDKELLRNILIQTCSSIEQIVRRYFKLKGMHALDHAGIKVDIWGYGWEDEFEEYSSNITIHDRVDPKELLVKCGNSKISLVYMGWQKRGCSEKNFDSMMNKAVCVTDTSTYLQKRYVDGYNLVYFDMHNPEQMAADIKYLLEHLNVAQVIADRGYETCQKYDSWDIRAEQIYQILCNVC